MLSKRLLTKQTVAESCGTVLLLLLSVVAGRAWGPHAAITQAALDALGTNDPLVVYLGPCSPKLTNYCLLGDYHRLLFEDSPAVFYADDYLLFPGASPQWDHTGMWLKGTFRPCFHRAAQALRTETPANAARWLGALLHYLQDAGAPPHALGLKGAVHWKMECWVNTNAIRIPGYRPRLLGTNDEQALEAFVQRMKELDEFARSRGKWLRLQIDLGNRKGVTPVVLECALESSRVTADLLHTLGAVALTTPAPSSAGIVGTISGGEVPGLERIPIKVLLQGTNLSTLADLNGRYEFKNLPAGTYQVSAMRPGGGTATAPVGAVAGKSNVCNLSFPKRPVNLLRNGDFALRWLSPNAPDCWYKNGGDWEGEFVPLLPGKQYRVAANFKTGQKGRVQLRWTRRPERPLPFYAVFPRFSDETLTAENNSLVFTASEESGVFQVILPKTPFPDTVLNSVTLLPVEGGGRF